MRTLLVLTVVAFWALANPVWAITSPQPADPPPAVSTDFKIVMISPSGSDPVQGPLIQIGLLAVANDPAQVKSVLADTLYVGIRDLTTDRSHAFFPGDRSLMIVSPERFAAMAIGAAPLPGADEVNPPLVPVEAGHRYQVTVQRGDQVVLQWTIVIAVPAKK